VEFGRNYEGKIVVAMRGEEFVTSDCVIHRPSNRRNALGIRVNDRLLISLETSLGVSDLTDATISVSSYGRDLGSFDGTVGTELKS
jgi:hypothetical protein